MNASFSKAVCRAALAALLLWATAAPGAGLDTSLVRAAGMKPYPVPLTAPAFRLPRLGDDASRTKGNYRGQVVLLNFWASWCPPCREEFPSLERLQEQFEGEEFTVLAVTVADDAVGVERFLGGREVPFDILIDTTERTADAYRAAGVPVTYLLDREGRLLAGKSGPDEWDSPAMVRLIRAAVEEQ
ncbi:Thiol-disulfide isomerase or thioredoxin [Thiohalomonas denitrificans]|uniref:Thiol-disulfide isomerase or thioredoxin n=1 Tax=Thiohalomonas denitrificans TaxID=415747 RepID=A0A1G5Q8Z6_9GAMM|nr:Thiol-disulfide isomerase or thioredoxin [Thiohalomonas denitrificans]